MMTRYKPTYSTVAVLSVALLFGCRGTLQVGLEQSPTPNRAPRATIAALATENSRLAVELARQATPPVPQSLGRLAFVQGGDIWVKALPDGAAQRLTTDGRNHDPRWSPSGEWLAFRKERQVLVTLQVPCDVPRPRSTACTEPVPVLQKQVWVMEADGGSAHPLYQGLSVEAFAWSPTGDRIAYSVADGELQSIYADGTDMSTLVTQGSSSGNSGRLGRFSWNPRGTWLAYEWKTQAADQSVTYEGLWQVSADGRERQEVFNSGAPQKGEAVLAGWSPLGRNILFWKNDAPSASVNDSATLFAISSDRDSSSAVPPARLNEQPMPASSLFIAPAPPLSSSGQRELEALIVGSGKTTWRNKRIELAGRVLTPEGIAAISPAWSPDGKHLAFAALPEASEVSTGESLAQELLQRRIWTMETGGAAPHALAPNSAYRDERPLWSADGNHILFARIDAKGRASLWVVPSAGGTPRQLVDELTPAPDPSGYFGAIDWDYFYSWWPG